MFYSIQSLINTCQRKMDKGNFESALHLIQSFVEEIVYLPQSAGNVISSPELDQLCQLIGSRLAAQQNITLGNYQQDLVVYIATKLYSSGGHTAVIEDLIRYQSTKKHLIVCTDLFNDIDNQSEIEKRFAQFNTKFVWAPCGSLQTKIIWLQNFLKEQQPARTFLFNHHQDVVAISAVQPQLVPQLFFFHHADHHLCLGVHLSYAIHIDAQTLGFHNCRNKLQIKNNIYWPLIVVDQGTRPNRVFMPEGTLTTCSCGSPMKFETPYLYSYAELIPEILAVTKGKHIHIGRLSLPTLQKIEQGLKGKKIAKEKFIYIPWVKSLWQAVLEHPVDLYLSSFPISGGRATIEIMGAGIPIMMHENYRSEYLGQVYMAYPETFFWRKPKELLNILKELSPEILKQHATFARHHYERYYLPELLEKELSKSVNDMRGLQPPSLIPYQSDALHLFLDNYRNFTLFNLLKKYLLALVFIHPYMTHTMRRIRKLWLKKHRK